MESDGYGLWSRFSDFASRQEAAELVPGSANYFEAVLNEMLPGLHQNTQVIHKFGRNVSGLKLLAITSGIKGHDLYSFNEFAVVPQTSEE